MNSIKISMAMLVVAFATSAGAEEAFRPIAEVPVNALGRQSLLRPEDEPAPMVRPEMWMDYDWAPFTPPKSTARCVRLNTCPPVYVGDAGEKV